jgi:hypothetical protein
MARPFSFVQDALEKCSREETGKGVSRSPSSDFHVAQRDRRLLGSNELLFRATISLTLDEHSEFVLL